MVDPRGVFVGDYYYGIGPRLFPEIQARVIERFASSPFAPRTGASFRGAKADSGASTIL
jgi:hypothetical protein